MEEELSDIEERLTNEKLSTLNKILTMFLYREIPSLETMCLIGGFIFTIK
jgi:hypothetical protein